MANISRNAPIWFEAKLHSLNSTLAADFEVQNIKTQKENTRADVSQITIAKKKLDQMFL